jgi:hypothetical protein
VGILSSKHFYEYRGKIPSLFSILFSCTGQLFILLSLLPAQDWLKNYSIHIPPDTAVSFPLPTPDPKVF